MKKSLPIIMTILLILILAPVITPGAFAMQAEPKLIDPGTLQPVILSEAPRSYSFIPGVNALYSVYLFPDSPDASANLTLTQGETVVARGEGVLNLSECRMIANTEYTITLTGSGSGYLEIARETLSRSFGRPLTLADSYSKLIAREGDVHWYEILRPESVSAILAAVPEAPDLCLRAWLFDESGALLQQAELLEPGTVVLSAALEPEKYLLRIAAVGSGTGKYNLSILEESISEPANAIALAESEIHQKGHSRFVLLAETLPEAASDLVFLNSSAPDVVRIRPDGTLETVGGGTATVTAYAYGGFRAECTVTVENVPVTGVIIEPDEIALREGDTAQLQVTLEPENASRRRLTFVTENERVVTVNNRGGVTAVGEGTARVVVITEDGSFSDVAFVTVSPAPKTYRALLIGEQNYASTVDKVRPGSINSVRSIESLLQTWEFADGEIETTTLMDAPRDSVIAGIRSVFRDAREGDVSLVYITCHGFYRAGMTFFVMADGSVLSARDLERELRKIPGEIILLADCCGSGGLLGEAGGTDDILDGITSVFHGTVGAPAMYGSKYRVIASALLDQDSYRISFSDDSEAGMATVFARALCDGMGWSIDRNTRSSMNADANYDGDITLNELGTYMARRVNWYLNLAGGYEQSVRTYPEGDSFVLFSRGSEE